MEKNKVQKTKPPTVIVMAIGFSSSNNLKIPTMLMVLMLTVVFTSTTRLKSGDDDAGGRVGG